MGSVNKRIVQKIAIRIVQNCLEKLYILYLLISQTFFFHTFRNTSLLLNKCSRWVFYYRKLISYLPFTSPRPFSLRRILYDSAFYCWPLDKGYWNKHLYIRTFKSNILQIWDCFPYTVLNNTMIWNWWERYKFMATSRLGFGNNHKSRFFRVVTDLARRAIFAVSFVLADSNGNR